MKRIIASGLALILALGGLTLALSPQGNSGLSQTAVAATTDTMQSVPAAAPETASAVNHEAPAAAVPANSMAARPPFDSKDPLLDLYFIGKRVSQIEPCGCQTKQRGGMQYEASLYNQHPGRAVIKVDAGEFTANRIDLKPVESLKGRYMIRAMNEMGFDAINVARSETQFNKTYFDSIGKETSGSLDNLVSCNIYVKGKPGEFAFRPYKIVERSVPGGRNLKIGITGATSINWSIRDSNKQLETESYLMTDPAESLKPMIEKLRLQCDIVVVLFAGSRDESMALADAYQQIDFMVTTAQLPDPMMLSFRDGKTMLLQTPNSMGKEVGMAEVAPSQREKGRWDAPGIPQSLYVAIDLPQNAPVLALINEFKQKTEGLDVEIPARTDMQEIYAGAQACAVCHRDVFDSWSATKHAHAMTALTNVGQQFNPECVQCHVTGYKRDNGFYTVKDRPSLDFINVQCEVCHGPAHQHVLLQQQILAGAERWKTPEEFAKLKVDAKQAVPPKKVAASVCIQCHHGENDPHFKFEEYAPKIDHHERKVVQGPPPQPPLPQPGDTPPSGMAAPAANGRNIVPAH